MLDFDDAKGSQPMPFGSAGHDFRRHDVAHDVATVTFGDEKDLGAFPFGPRAVPASWSPALAMWEGEKEVLLCVDMPGVARDHVHVSVEGRSLVVAGSRASGGLELRGRPRPSGSFRRVVLLPKGLRTQDLATTMKDGVLGIRIPRDLESASRDASARDARRISMA